MATPTIEEIYDKEIRPRSREERERLVELASKDLECEDAKVDKVDNSTLPHGRTLELFERWRKEDAAMTPEEVEQERADWEELKANLNAERDRAGARRLFNA